MFIHKVSFWHNRVLASYNSILTTTNPLTWVSPKGEHHRPVRHVVDDERRGHEEQEGLVHPRNIHARPSRNLVHLRPPGTVLAGLLEQLPLYVGRGWSGRRWSVALRREHFEPGQVEEDKVLGHGDEDEADAGDDPDLEKKYFCERLHKNPSKKT